MFSKNTFFLSESDKKVLKVSIEEKITGLINMNLNDNLLSR